MTSMSRGPGCPWPWPYFLLSNGIELEMQEVIDVRCIKAVSTDRSKSVYKADVGQIVQLRAHPRGVSLVKFGKGNTNWLTINPNPVEGVDYEIIPGRKIRTTNSDARELVDNWMGPARAATRRAREFNQHTYIVPKTSKSTNLIDDLMDLLG